MCPRSKTDPAVLERRQNGLDSRGNVPSRTRAESEWATGVFKTMDEPTAGLMAGDILALYAKATQVGGIDKPFTKKFKSGVLEIFGDDLSRKPSAEQLSALMFSGKYGFKDATDAINRVQKKADAPLYNQGRSGQEFADEKGRLTVRARKNSFSNLDAGITDRVNRDDTSRDFFATKTVHAKGMMKGDPTSDIYQLFADAGAPFIGGASGTMQGLIMGMEMRTRRTDLSAQELAAREKLIGLHMAALISGGHHSASECLIAAKKYGYFANVSDPVGDDGDYEQAMQDLGVRLTQVGLPTDLTPKDTAVGDPWRRAVAKMQADLNRLEQAIGKEYAQRQLDPGPLLAKFKTEITDKMLQSIKLDLADTLDSLPRTKNDQNARNDLLTEARDELRLLRGRVKDNLVVQVEGNPFLPLSLQGRLAGALDLIAKEIVGPA